MLEILHKIFKSKLFIAASAVAVIILILIIARKSGSWETFSSAWTNGHQDLYKTEIVAGEKVTHLWEWNNRTSQYQDVGQIAPEYSYEKNLNIGSTTLKVSAVAILVEKDVPQVGNLYVREYQFYTANAKPKFLEKIGSVFYLDTRQAREPDTLLFTKDITGDGVDEIFVQVETSANGAWEYEILRLESGGLVHLKDANAGNDWVGFTRINYKDGYVYRDWADAYETGRSRYILKDDLFVRDKSVGFEWDYHTNICKLIIQGPGDSSSTREFDKCSGSDFEKNFNLDDYF